MQEWTLENKMLNFIPNHTFLVFEFSVKMKKKQHDFEKYRDEIHSV